MTHQDEALGHAIRHARESAGLTQQAVATEVGMLGTVLSRIERGSRPCRANELVKIARAVGRSAGSLFDEAAPPTIQQQVAAVTRSREVARAALEDYERTLCLLEDLVGVAGMEAVLETPVGTDSAPGDRARIDSTLDSMWRRHSDSGKHIL